MTYWFRAMLWTVLGVITSCCVLIGLFKLLSGQRTLKDMMMAPIVIDEPMDECSISATRNFVIATTMLGKWEQKIYNLKTGDEIEYPAAPDLEGYGEILGWINDPTQDAFFVEPHWMVNLTTGVVSKTKTLGWEQDNYWWASLVIPGDGEVYSKSPDQQYVAGSGSIYRATNADPPLGEVVVDSSFGLTERCINAWEPDSSGYYFIDVNSRFRVSGPLHFVRNPER
ncbi:hypothetical protein [Herpetosiphon geysericola]|uniref:Uncharacterized protein n=1 Tax=Herpetosiphon geysericola TaxID=70996 RepID=A0A0P6XYT8_9CHLR|nr:hypothetical protein [Herpetosiphon geysericola]KPL81527.1 hypothetical protein SE18_23205 [Herpetosiphon geysericola]